MTVDELKEHGLKYSQTFKRGYGLWADAFPSMCRKTVIKFLLNRYAPLSIEMETAMKADQAVITENGEQYIDNDNSANPTKTEEYQEFEEVEEVEGVDTETGEIKEDKKEEPKEEAQDKEF